MLATPVQDKRIFPETLHRIPPDPRKDVTLEVGQKFKIWYQSFGSMAPRRTKAVW